ncbi:MAG TPA: response regulator [Smithellaceae bacterium]|nr:response regulator [Smithellaceae bacterium]
MLEQIVPQSAGSLSVAILALMMMVIQVGFVLRKPRIAWYGWSAAVSFAGLIYAAGVFLEYNTPAGTVKRMAGLLEFSALLVLLHAFVGLTFSYLRHSGKRYHLIAGAFHLILLTLLWRTNLIVSDQFVERHFPGLDSPFVELDIGVLGAGFVAYIIISGAFAVFLWLRDRRQNIRHKKAFLASMIIWLGLGIHDGLAVFGFPIRQYMMEYGFFIFSFVTLLVVFDSYTDAEAESKYRVITEYANDGILVIQDGRVVFDNPACEEIFGRSLDGLAAIDLLSHINQDDYQILMEHYDRLLRASGVDESISLKIRTTQGKEKHLEIRANAILYRGRQAILTVMRDVTQRISEETILKEQEEKLQRLKKMESLGLLAGGVAHDLNNVLSGIVSYPELMLLDLPADSPLRKPLSTIHDSGLRASAIVQDLLTIARGVAITKQSININEIIMSYLTSPECRKLMQFHPSVRISTDLDPRLLFIKGSTAHIRKALMNLVSNASEAIPDKGVVSIKTSNRYVEHPIKGYDTVRTGEYVVLSVSDDGPGISPQDIERIFEPFYTKKVMGRSGTGLGLTVVWNAVSDHEGYIDVISSDKGATFELYFPSTREAAICPTAAPVLADLAGKGQTILVVDDVASQREITCSMLEALGYQAASVESGEAALAYLTDHRVDLVILDMIMDPGIDGRETYERILRIRPGQRAVIVSGFAETQQVQETLRLGACRFLKKPLILEDLGLALKNVLS